MIRKQIRKHMKIIINAIPVAQPRQRHRVIQSGGRAFASNYTPKNDPVNTFKAACQMTVSELQIPLIDEPVIVDFVFVMPRPKKFDAKKFGDGRLPHGSKPDRASGLARRSRQSEAAAEGGKEVDGATASEPGTEGERLDVRQSLAMGLPELE